MKIIHISLFTILILSIGIFFFLSLFFNNYSQSSPEYPEIEFTNLTSSQQEIAQNLINNLEDEYLKTANEIIFVPNKHYIDKNRGGVNYVNQGKIIISITSSRGAKWTLCHELIHNIIIVEPDEAQYFAIDLSNKLVCYKDG